MQAWPPPSPLTDEEVRRYFDRELTLLLRAMNLGDGEGICSKPPENLCGTTRWRLAGKWSVYYKNRAYAMQHEIAL